MEIKYPNFLSVEDRRLVRQLVEEGGREPRSDQRNALARLAAGAREFEENTHAALYGEETLLRHAIVAGAKRWYAEARRHGLRDHALPLYDAVKGLKNFEEKAWTAPVPATGCKAPPLSPERSVQSRVWDLIGPIPTKPVNAVTEDEFKALASLIEHHENENHGTTALFLARLQNRLGYLEQFQRLWIQDTPERFAMMELADAVNAYEGERRGSAANEEALLRYKNALKALRDIRNPPPKECRPPEGTEPVTLHLLGNYRVPSNTKYPLRTAGRWTHSGNWELVGSGLLISPRVAHDEGWEHLKQIKLGDDE